MHLTGGITMEKPDLTGYQRVRSIQLDQKFARFNRAKFNDSLEEYKEIWIRFPISDLSRRIDIIYLDTTLLPEGKWIKLSYSGDYLVVWKEKLVDNI